MTFTSIKKNFATKQDFTLCLLKMSYGNFNTKVRGQCDKCFYKTKIMRAGLSSSTTLKVKLKSSGRVLSTGSNIGANQRTIYLVEQENYQPQYSTFQYFCKKKKTHYEIFFIKKSSFFCCLSLVEPTEGGRSKLSPHFRWLLGFFQALGTINTNYFKS